MKEFLIDWRYASFKVAFGNWLIGFTKWFVDAERIELTYKKKKVSKT